MARGAASRIFAIECRCAAGSVVGDCRFRAGRRRWEHPANWLLAAVRTAQGAGPGATLAQMDSFAGRPGFIVECGGTPGRQRQAVAGHQGVQPAGEPSCAAVAAVAGLQSRRTFARRCRTISNAPLRNFHRADPMVVAGFDMASSSGRRRESCDVDLPLLNRSVLVVLRGPSGKDAEDGKAGRKDADRSRGV